VVASLLEGATDVGPTMCATAEKVGGHLANRAAPVLHEHLHGDREDCILGRATRAFLAPIAGERVHGPRPHLIVLVREIRHELGNGGLVQVVVQDDAAPHAHGGIVMPEPVAQGGRRQRTGKHQLA
jgi:hypothetical protein